MKVHRSNRLERLADVLAEVVREPIGGPFDPEVVVVQGPGMARWVSMQLAERLGVWAAPDFPYPRHLVRRAIDGLLGPAPGSAPGGRAIEPEDLAFAVAAALPARLEEPGFEPLRGYLARDPGGRRLLSLSERVARIFDGYVLYRPELVRAWEQGADLARAAGADARWQAQLFRDVAARAFAGHVAQRAGAFVAAARSGGAPIDGLPRRICLFAPSALPPLYLEILAALSHRHEVHLFLLAPSREYWADVRSRREVLRAHQRALATGAASELDLERLLEGEGHPLLASLGRLGRDLQCCLEGLVDYEDGAEPFEEPDEGSEERDEGSLLHTLQSDILHLRHRGVSPGAARKRLPKEDASIEIHSCHGPMREIEVLRDRLLALFDAYPKLEPGDVVVLAPDIEVYAPAIDAVFGAHGTAPRIPYHVADRQVRATEELVEAFLAILAVLDGRFPASAVLDLLALEPIRQRFGIAATDLDTIRGWVEEAGIRWGVDAAHRAQEGQPALAQNTWRFGLDRLLLGYAVAGHGRRLFAGTLPHDGLEAAEAPLLGRFVELCETLFWLRARARVEQSLPAHVALLRELMTRLLSESEEGAHERRTIARALDAIEAHAATAALERPFSLAAVRGLLERRLGVPHPSRGFLAGGVTFCQLVPMRSIPFEVVCLVGMSDDAYPRRDVAPSFDLVAAARRPGDRSRRDEDRHLFLEAILSARRRLIITFVGQSIRGNERFPPSVLVGELLDALGEGWDAREGLRTAEERQRAIRERLVVEQPLHPFDPRAFDEAGSARLWSFATAHLEGARALLGPRAEAPPFLEGALALPEEPRRELALRDLERFLQEPVRRFLERRLGLTLGRDEAEADDRPPVELDPLARWKLGEELVTRTLEGRDAGLEAAIVRASGALPLGVPGDCVYGRLREVTDAVVAAARARRGGEPLASLGLDREIDGTRLVGELDGLFPGGLVQASYGSPGGRRELAAWVRHLALQLAGESRAPRETYLVCRAGGDQGGATVVRLGPVEDAERLLADLLALHRLGERAPLPLFEGASRTYAEALASGHDARRALQKARGAWDGDERFARRDLDDPYVACVFAGLDPLDPAFRAAFDPALPTFAELAQRVYGPLLSHREQLR